MGMSAGGSDGGLTNEINVTPMIDVLLVLLIIFMVIIPLSRKAIDTQLPDPNPQVQAANDPTTQIVLEVLPGGQYRINSEDVNDAQLYPRLKAIYDPRPDKVIFIRGDSTVTYADVVHAMDVARGAGVIAIGVAPKPQ